MLSMGIMATHTQASQKSRDLCDQLFAAVQKAIPKSKRSSTIGSCGLYQEGRTRFAYVYHSGTHIEIWCRGDINDLMQSNYGLHVVERIEQRPGWEKSFPARFQISSTDQIVGAVSLLKNVSFSASKRKSNA
jgi:hypothetical protein